MIRIRTVELGKSPKIAASFRGGESISFIQAAFKQGLHLAELRADLFPRRDAHYALQEIKKFRFVPKILTIRTAAEGGSWKGSENERLRLFRTLLPHTDAIDIELSSELILREVVRLAKRRHKTVIISNHDFHKMPSFTHLGTRMRKAKSLGADIVKLAAWSSCASDTERMASFTRLYRSEHLVTIAMGEAGKISRITFSKLGSLFTFAHLGKSSAPGQRSLAETRAGLHLRS